MKHRFTLEIEYGSDWQKNLGEQMLAVFLQVFKSNIESKHKKNRVNILAETWDK
jgi:hypothetical protein